MVLSIRFLFLLGKEECNPLFCQLSNLPPEAFGNPQEPMPAVVPSEVTCAAEEVGAAHPSATAAVGFLLIYLSSGQTPLVD